MQPPFYETRQGDEFDSVDVLLHGERVAVVTKEQRNLSPTWRYVARGVEFDGESPAFKDPTYAVLWAMKAHRSVNAPKVA